ncbi:MAG: SGNH/GDSL hydrolase family protein, partial [Limimaricola sp.]
YEGGAGFDVLHGGAGADRFVWGMDALDGNRDLLYYFSAAAGHVIDLSKIAEHYGWNQSQAEAAVSVTDGPNGALLSVTTPDLGTISLIDIRDAAASEVTGALLLVSGPPPDTGDDDGNMALTLPDDRITIGEEGNVEVVLSGLDADATAVITISDGTNSLSSSAIPADGSVFFDLSGFDDGAVTTEVTATDAGGNATTRQGPGLTLDTAPDTSADADGNLALTAPDTEIDAFEAGDVQMTVTGIDDDADAVVEISDGTTTLTRALAADGSVSFDLTGLQDGPLTSRVVVNDTTGNTASVEGPGLTLDTVTPPPAENEIFGTSGNDTLIPESTGSILHGLAGNDKLFNGDGDDILYGGDGRDTLRGGGGDDVYEGGAGFDVLHGGAGADRFVWGMDALDGNRDLLYYFSAAGGHVIDLSAIAEHYGWNQSQAEAAVSVTDGPNGALLSVATPDLGTISLIDIRDAAASDITPATGTLLLTGASADDDANMALTLPDTIITAGEEGAVEVVLSGLDADATAVITISDGTNSLSSAAISADGPVFFDLSSFNDGAVTTEVTANDSEGNTTIRSGPGFWIASSGTLSLAGEVTPVVIDLAAETYATAARVLAIGDSLTVGWRDRNDPAEIDAEREGFRQDLFERIATDGGWYDYVGPYQNGPAGMLDRDHAGVAGWEMAQLIANGYFTNMLEDHAPDVTLLMLGTNDLDGGTADVFGTQSKLVSDLTTAVEQFYAVPGNDDRHLVVSTLAPLIRRDNEPDHAYFANEGYSIVGGTAVAGDAGNGTYVPGIKATIAGLQASHPTLMLFENPHAAHPPADTADQTDHLTGDEVHWSASAYTEYADALADLLVSGIGLEGGTFGGSPAALPGIANVTGTEAGDRIRGDAGDNRLDGGGGNDLLEGRGGADQFVFDEKSLTQSTPDRIADFNAAENDMIDVSAISSFFGWTLSQAQAAFELVAVTGGVDLTVTESGSTTSVAHAAQITLGDISLADDVILV